MESFSGDFPKKFFKNFLIFFYSSNCKDQNSNNPDLICTGRGECLCGACDCDANFRGEFCECDNFSCTKVYYKNIWMWFRNFPRWSFFKKLVKSNLCLFGELFWMLETYDWLNHPNWSNQSEASNIYKRSPKRQKYDFTSFFFSFRDLTINCVPETEIAFVEIVIVFLVGPVLIVVVQRQQMIVLENSVPSYAQVVM